MKRVYLLSFTDWYFDVFCFLMEPCRCDVYSSSDLNAVSFFIFLVCSEFGRKRIGLRFGLLRVWVGF